MKVSAVPDRVFAVKEWLKSLLVPVLAVRAHPIVLHVPVSAVTERHPVRNVPTDPLAVNLNVMPEFIPAISARSIVRSTKIRQSLFVSTSSLLMLESVPAVKPMISSRLE